MKTGNRVVGVAVAVLLAGLASVAPGQQSAPPTVVPEAGFSDIGTLEQVPYRLQPLVPLRAEDKDALRKLEDKHIAELRALEDRYERDLRAQRAKQQSERESMLKAFAARR